MAGNPAMRSSPFGTQAGNDPRMHNSEEPEDWEDWEDDEPSTPRQSHNPEQHLIEVGSGSPSKNSDKAHTRPISAARASMSRIKRLKSRQRQKAQNEKAGITLVTDMSKLRRQQHIAQQLKPNPEDSGTGKFVDAAALRALEGEPSSASIGSFNWLKKKASPMSKGKKVEQKPVSPLGQQDLSPNDRPIVIGISLPSDDLANRMVSPLTASTLTGTPVEFPVGNPQKQRAKNTTGHAQEQRSVWSPDTDDGGNSPYWSSRVASSVYSQSSPLDDDNVPSVPAIPANFKTKQPRVSVVSDLDDADTPVTLFEEDGSPILRRKSTKKKNLPAPSAGSRTASQGWWDQVVTPFTERPSPSSALDPGPSVHQGHDRDESWTPPSDEKRGLSRPRTTTTTTGQESHAIERQASRTASPRSPPVSTPRQSPRIDHSSSPNVSNKEVMVMVTSPQPSEQPPPYSPPSKQNNIRYRAYFPPGHLSVEQSPPSPGPVSPGLQNTMTSQGAIRMSDVPLTPPPPVVAAADTTPMPNRPLGSFVTGDHFQAARGERNRVERQRRRHEKEEAVARRIGGLWKGRGCLPENGCYGRGGREGRKKRRICLGILASVLAALILLIVLAVVLTRHHAADTVPYSIWLNLTDFPPMPTGVLTVIGPDNTKTQNGCVGPPTAWSCSLPKEQQGSAGPYAADQPEFIFQIQYDNSSKQLWNVTGQETPHPTTIQPTSSPASSSETATATSDSTAALASAVSVSVGKAKKRDAIFDEGINPDPAPRSFQEMWFLGNTTDDIVSDEKAGEPTPFYMSLLTSLNDTVGPNLLTRRDSGNASDSGNSSDSSNINDQAPPPVLNPDGSGAPAVLIPHPTQQPVRLFDRGLPTEHYGFYSYFSKSIYLQSIDLTGTDANSDQTANLPDINQADTNGGSLASEANYIIYYEQMRFLVQIWTRRGNTTQLLSSRAGPGTNATQPGTFPYPVTLTVDNHGGDDDKKATFYRPVEQPGVQINATFAKFYAMNLAFGGTLINSGFANDTSFGGIDGGTGGCKCEYENYVGVNGN